MQGVLTSAHLDFERALNKHAFFKVNDHNIGEDLVQDTFLKTWAYLVKGGEIVLMRAFLYHILNNLIIDQYRKPKTTSLDVLLEKNFEPSTDITDSLFNIIDGKAAALLIERLPEKYQKVMKMRHIELLSLKEISAITGQSQNTIAVQTHRGLMKLKVLYDNPLPGGAD